MSTPMRALALAAAATLLLTACSSEPPETPTAGCDIPVGPMAIAVGGRANMPGITGTPLLQQLATTAAANQSTVTLIDTGGTPAPIVTLELQLTSKNPVALKREQTDKARTLATELVGVRASTPEANPLEALNRAADAVAGPGPGTVVLIDSGLQTAGAFSYLDGAILATPEDLVAGIREAGQMPDLTGRSVFLIGIGDTAEPQRSLDTAARGRLEAHWRAVATAAGAACVYLDPSSMTGQSPSGLPAVTPAVISDTEVVDLLEDGPAALGEDKVRFVTDSAQFADPEAAQQALQPYADWLQQTSTRVLLTGTTATDGTEEGRIRLSQMRAEKVRDALVALGADAGLIETRGVGTNHPTHVPDIGPDGELLEGKAVQNRLVIISVREQG